MSARRIAKLALPLLLGLACAPPPPVPPAAPVAEVASQPPPLPPLPRPVDVDVAEAPRAPGASCFVGGLKSPLFSGRDPSLGAPDAPVVLVEFAEFQDLFAARALGTLRKLRDKYGDEKLRIVWRHEPLSFHEHARPAAEAAEAVFQLTGSLGFFRFHDEAFGDQTHLDDASFARWARIAGVSDLDAFRAAVASRRFSAKIDEDLEAAKQLGVQGSPHFFINGVAISGAQPVAEFTKVIDAELAATAGQHDASTPCARSAANFQRKPANDDDTTASDEGARFRVPVSTSPVRGPATALVTIVEFSDFQCPFCKRVEPTLAKVRAEYGDKVRIVWKDEPLPFHPRAEPAAELAREALRQRGPAAFWEAHDALFEAQPKLEDADLLALAATLRLDVAAVRAAIATNKHKGAIAADQDLADDVQANGTPHFFINGQRLVGAQPFTKFKEVIDLELDRARAFVARGVAPAAIYETLQKDARGPVEPEKKTVAAAPKAPFKGNAGGKVVIQEFSDFQCPFCKRANDTLAEVEKAYPGRIKIVWRHMPLPFHKDARLAAEAAEEVRAQKGNAGFWKMHDLLFQHQSDAGGLARPALEGYAQTLGCDLARFQSALDGHVHAAAIDADTKAAEDAKINGTPGFVVNGMFLSGAQPFAKFKRVVDRALAH